MKKITLIGPVLPYRGGIAQHTTMLKRALEKLCDLRTYSFKRQYPKLIFPGESDKDASYEGYLENDVLYTIDSINPITWEKTAKKIIKSTPDIVIIAWWTIFWFPCFFYITSRLKIKNIPVYFFCHNVIEHETSLWKKYFTKLILKNGQSYIVQSNADKNNLLKALPNRNVIFHPHPIYNQFPSPKSKLTRRSRLELLFYGFVRPYKGLDILLEAIAKIKSEDLMLTIAGEFWSGKEETMRKITSLDIDDKIELIPSYISDEDTAELFSRADIIILPYRSATGTGVIPIAYHYNKPVLATKVGGLPDVVIDNKTGWLIQPNSPDAIANAISNIDLTDINDIETEIKQLKNSLTWEHMANTILDTIN